MICHLISQDNMLKQSAVKGLLYYDVKRKEAHQTPNLKNKNTSIFKTKKQN